MAGSVKGATRRAMIRPQALGEELRGVRAMETHLTLGRLPNTFASTAVAALSFPLCRRHFVCGQPSGSQDVCKLWNEPMMSTVSRLGTYLDVF